EEFVYRQRLSETLRDHASLQDRVGRLREADDSLRRAVQIAEKMRAEAPSQPGGRQTVAFALLDLSAVEFTRGLVAESGKSAGRAAELFREAINAPPEAGHSPYDPLLLAAALDRSAVAERELGRLDAARALHLEAIKQLDGLVEKKPEGVNLADVLNVLAR